MSQPAEQPIPTALADGGQCYASAWARGIRPDPLMWVDEWAERYMVLPRGSAAEYGRYRVSRTPYAREVMRCLSPAHPAKRVVAKVASQLFKTQVGLNWIGALIHQAPGNALVLLPTDKLAKRVSARIHKTIDEVPELASRVAKPRSRDSRNTIDVKEFDGGTLYITTAGSAANLAEIPARYIYGDEIDRWEIDVDGEGSPLELAETRGSTFGRNAKFYYTSTPTEEGVSVIDDLYARSDQREYQVPCPHCAAALVLVWEQMRWDEDLTRAWYVCEHCGCEIEEHAKPAMLAAGRWVPRAPGDGETVGFHLSALYAPIGWTSWVQLAKQYTRASEALARGETEPMQVFHNTRLALTWSSVSGRIKSDQLRELVEPFPLGVLPDGALFLTAAVDVQGNRLEVLLIGWGPGLERWTVNVHTLPGSPTEGNVWRDLSDFLALPISNRYGRSLVPEIVMVDSSAYSQEVYAYVRRAGRRVVGNVTQRILAIKGASTPRGNIIGSKPSKVDISESGRVLRWGMELWIVGVFEGKDWVTQRAMRTSGEGAIHYSADLPADFFAQLTAEAKQVRYVKGYKRVEWRKIVNGAPNEALDLMVYNLAAAHHKQLHRKPPAWWAQRRELLCPPTGDLFSNLPSAAARETPVTERPPVPDVTRSVPVRRPLIR